VGVELGQGLARLGSKVSIVERSERLVDNEETDVGETLARALKRDGARLYTRAKVTSVRRKGDAISVGLADGQRLEAECLLISTGRRPNTAALNAEVAGIELDEKGHVRVDTHFRTSNPNVYAIGDVTGQPGFTHVSWEDYRRLCAILTNGHAEGAEDEERHQQDRVLGYVFFTEPQVGRVGLTLDEARARGLQAEAVTLPLTDVARAGHTGHELGFYRMVIDRQSEKILGATLVGPQCGELAHVFLAHMEAGSTWRVLERSVHIHPTYAEALPVLARKFAEIRPEG
jgi:pyruvate/2-oxoglutarate dehydrogenase complex dihydrolipoamide dehydrogenase (E3) component